MLVLRKNNKLYMQPKKLEKEKGKKFKKEYNKAKSKSNGLNSEI